jgi:hypothetical protein
MRTILAIKFRSVAGSVTRSTRSANRRATDVLKSVAILVILTIGLGVLSGCLLPGGCEAFVRREVPSLDGQYVAVIWVWGCGVTTSSETIVSVRHQREPFSSKSPFIFAATTAGSQSSTPTLLPLGEIPLLAEWTASNRLRICVPPGYTYRTEKPTMSDVLVEVQRCELFASDGHLIMPRTGAGKE